MDMVLNGRYRLLEAPGQVELKAEDLLLGGERTVRLFPLAEIDASALSNPALQGRIRHPNLVEVYEAGQIDQGPLSGHAYVVSEVVAGTTLRTLVDTTGRADVDTLIRIGRSGLTALSALHGLGLHHGALDPARLLLLPGGVKLMELGLSALHRATNSDYQAPEVRAGAAPGARSDLWALGCCLYEAATARLPDAEGAIPVDELRPDMPQPLARAIGILLTAEPRARDADAVRALLGQEGPPLPAHVEPRFVGRDRALRAISAAVDEAQALAAAGRAAREASRPGQTPPLLVISAPEGLGKTRLLQQAASRLARRGQRVLWGQGFGGGGPYSGWRSLIERAARVSEAPELTERARAGVASGQGREVDHEHVARFLLDLARAQPVALLIDDAHLFDAPSAELLLHVARAAAAPGAPGALAIVLGVRPDPGAPLLTALEAPLAPAHAELALGELSPELARELVESVIGREGKAPAEIDRLARLGGGSPFLLVELASEWRRGGGTPASVQEAISARLAQASLPARSLLQGMAVLGRPVPLATLEPLAGKGPPLAEQLSELIGLGLLVPDGLGGHRFRQEITRRILHDALGDEELMTVSRRALQALEHDPQASAGERARLALQARVPGAADLALEAAPGDPAPQELYEGAIELLSPGPQRVEAQRLLAGHLLSRSAFAEARRALEVAALDLEGVDADPRALAEICLAQAEVASAEGETHDTLQWAAAGHEALREAGESAGALRARLLSVEGRAYTLRGDHAGAAGRYADAMRSLKEAEDDPRLRARLMLDEAQSLVLSLDKARYPEARERILEAMEILRAAGDTSSLQDALRILGNHAFYSGELQNAERCFREALELSEEAADLTRASGMLNNLGMVAMQQDQLRRAEGLLERALDIADRIGQPSVLCRAYTNVGRVRRALNDLRGANRSFKRASRIARSCGDAMIESAALSELGTTRLLQGRAEAALHALRRSQRLRLRLGDAGRVAMSELELGELWRTAGDVRAALRCTTRALALQAAFGDAEAAAIAVEALEFAVGRPGGPAALLIMARRPVRPARRAPQAVRDGLRRGGLVAEQALRLLAAALTARAGDPEQAQTHAGHAARARRRLAASGDLTPAVLALTEALELEARAVVAACRGETEQALAHLEEALAGPALSRARRGALFLKQAFLLLSMERPADAAVALGKSVECGQSGLSEVLWERRRVGHVLVAAAIRRAGEEPELEDKDLLPLAKAHAIARRLGDVALLALVSSTRAEAATDASPLEATQARADARIAAKRLASGLPGSLRDSLSRAAAPVPDEDTVAPALAPDQTLLLSMVSRVLSTGLELEPLLEASMDALLEGTGARRGLVSLRLPGGDLDHRAARNIDRTKLPMASRDVIESVAREGLAVLVNDTARISFRFTRGRGTPRSILAVPIRTGDDVVGVVYLDHPRQKNCFGRAESALVGAFAARVAGPIQGSLTREKRMGELSRLAEAYKETARELGSEEEGGHQLVGRSPPMRALDRLIQRYGNTNAPVTIFGESGTGKELVAKAVHLASKRSSKPFIVINCSAMTDTLLESELFGVVKGAFTGADQDRKGLFELAHEGTLFLDEVGDMSLDMQAKLLRVLESGELRPVGGRQVVNVDVRVISATHRDLRELAGRGEFREDLFYRLNVLRLELPPLRERREDIPLLCAHFLQRTAQRNEHPPKELQPEAIERLLQHSFPGNVRELQNAIERACALEPGISIGPERLNLDARQSGDSSPSPAYHKTFQFKGVALNRRQQQVLDHLRSGVAAITNRDYCTLVGVSERTGLRDLSHLVEGGLLLRIGKRKGARYQLNPGALEQ